MARPALIARMSVGAARVDSATMTPARFDAFYEELRAPLRGYLRRVTKNAAEADDLFQETWIRLLTHPPRVFDPATVRAYVFTIATHLARDAWRHESWIGRFLRPRRGETDPAHDDALETVRDPRAGPAASFETKDDLLRSLGPLTARERALLWLAHVERYEHREIAVMLGIRARSVRVLLHRARKRALAALAESESTAGGER